MSAKQLQLYYESAINYEFDGTGADIEEALLCWGNVGPIATLTYLVSGNTSGNSNSFLAERHNTHTFSAA